MENDTMYGLTPCGSRRQVLRRLAGAGMGLWLPRLAWGAAGGRVRFGVISDVHQDIMHDGPKRLGAFVEAMREAEVDFILQLGDFCIPTPANQAFLDLWNAWPGDRYHVLGNHDMDGGKTRRQAVDFLGMPGHYYHIDRQGVRFIALDGNDPGGGARGYARFIGKDQLDWLDARLEETDLPVVIWIHQPLESAGGVVNQEEVRRVLEKNRSQGPGVVAVLSGHLHQDYVRKIGGIAHIQINSASYVWLPGNHRLKLFADRDHASHPHLDRVAPYRDPLWAVVTLDLDAASLHITGRSSEWVGPDPWSRGASEKELPRELQRPAIRDWNGSWPTPRAPAP